MDRAHSMLLDRRTIKSIQWPNDEGSSHTVGHSCDAITVYEEPGVCNPLPYLAIWKDARIMSRVPAWHVEIFYDVATENVGGPIL